MIEFIVFSLSAYLLGSIPSAVWVGKALHGIDVREHGSKNAGATNTFRVLGKKAGIIVLLMDVLKGVAAVFLPRFLSEGNEEHIIQLELLAGVFVFLGHLFPLFAGFRGGKGVATSLGIIIGIHPPAAGVCFLVFLIVFISTHYVSLGAIAASFCFPFVVILVFQEHSPYLVVFSIVIGITVIATHKKNIQRLVQGQENKMNLFKK
ncbi:MAG: Glycerol-3-phosphate acyltransferase [Crocinitomicaceae bacterium]|jgi:glycerol-3-phosphate acyltransferase PlsY|nr:Glycerol-3-phosphate acyltransferase [Crocinitomicaceae bacterium]